MNDGLIKDVLTLQLEVQDAYADLAEKTRTAQAKASVLRAAREAWGLERIKILIQYKDEPTALGKNEQAREAVLRDKTLVESEAHDTAAEVSLVANDAVQIAQLRVDSLRAQLRCYEVIAGLTEPK